jgi:hypothetical protein
MVRIEQRIYPNVFTYSDNLKLKAADSVIPGTAFEENPTLSTDVYSKLTGAFTSDISGNISIDMHETYYANLSDTYPAAVSYNLSKELGHGGLEEIDRISARVNVGISNGAISQECNYVVISTYESSVPQFPIAPHIFKLEFHRVVNGIFDKTPVVFNLADLDPNYYNATLAYNNLLGLSKDGKYAIVSYAIGPNPSQPGVITDQVIEILEVKDDLSVKSIAKSILPNADLDGFTSFSVGAIAWKDYWGIYNVEVSVNSWNLAQPLGNNSQMAHYTFDPSKNHLKLNDTFWVPQYIEDFDVDICTGDVYVALEAVGTGPSIYQSPLPIYPNDAIDKNSELQIIRYQFGQYHYLEGYDIGEYAVQVRLSNDRRKLALVTASSLVAYIDESVVSPLGAPTRIAAPNEIKLYNVYRYTQKRLDLRSTGPAPPLSFGLAFNSSNDLLSVAGMTTYQNVSGIKNGQKGKVLYELN